MTIPAEPTPEGSQTALRERLADYVKATATDEHVDSSLTEAAALVDEKLAKGNTHRAVPDPVRDRAVIEVAADLFYRRQTRMGVSGFADNDLNPMRISRDPMKACEGILAPYLLGGFA